MATLGAGLVGSKPAVKGILKSMSSIAAKREAERATHFDAAAKEIWFKVLVLGATGSGKSSIVRSFAAEKQLDAYEPTDSVETTTLLAAMSDVRLIIL
jgi:GTPase SAR1 family protein